MDQYFAVVDPLHYHHTITKFRCHILCLITWILSLSLGLLSITDFQTGAYGVHDSLSIAFNLCATAEQESPSVSVAMIYASVTFILPFLLLCFCYTRIFCAAHENSVKTRRNSVCSATFETLNNNNNSATASPYYGYHSTYLGVSQSRTASVRSTGSNLAVFTSNLKTSMRHKLSNASAIFTYREEGRAAKVTILVLVMILACWGPHFCLGLVKTFAAREILPAWAGSLALVLASCSSCLSPLLYAYRSRRVQRDIRKVLGINNPVRLPSNTLR